uniref:Uncharacterized protein n=1 Tax=Panagrolaimus sp. PS1159 TaxID=55785 RepID=A0AC35FKV0_9BILA
MLKPNDRLATVANALRASTSEPNLRKKLLATASGSVKESKPEKSLRDPAKIKAKKVSRSSDSESSDTEDKDFLKAELILKFKKYDHSWFKQIAATHPEYFIDSRQYVHYERNSSTIFVGHDKVVANFINFIRVFNISKHGYSLMDIKCEGAVACVQSSPDFNHLAVSVDAVQGAKIVMYDSRDMDQAVRDFSTIILASQIRISLTNETILLFTESDDKAFCRIALYSFDGTFLSELSLNLPNPSKNFEISFCPADETIICVITDDTCYFMRATTNVITVFSTIKFFDISCHGWVDDVTLGFGTFDGQIRLYRETVALEVVNLKSLQNNLIGNYDPKQSHVLKMFGNDQYLLVYVQIGVIFVFPAGNLKDRWKNSKAIIINSLKTDTLCNFLHMDQSNDNILYGDNESISLCNVNYAEAICDNGLRLITAKNSKPIKQICFEHRSNMIAVLDRDGLILITSMINKRTISHGYFKNAIAIALLPHGQKLLIAEMSSIVVYHVLFHELLKGETIWEEKVEAVSIF